jgi:hypothetical protein
MLHIGAGFFAALDEYVHGVCSAHVAACGAGVDEIVNDFKYRASKSPQWAGLSDSIESWVEDGVAMVGVRDPHVVSRALDAEYGSSSTPPSPIIRMTQGSSLRASKRMDSVYRSILGDG